MTVVLSADSIGCAERMLDAIKDNNEDLVKLRQALTERQIMGNQKVQYSLSSGQMIEEIGKAWSQHGRQVLSIHPDLLNEIRTADSAKIPPEVFATLPYINPMVIFPHPVDFGEVNGEWIKMHGFICYGLKHTGYNMPETERILGSMIKFRGDLSNTDDPLNNKLGFCAVLEVRGQGRSIYDYMRLSLPLDGERTVKEMIETLKYVFQWTSAPGGDPERKVLLEGIFKVCVGSLLYLCGQTLDVEIIPRIRTRKMNLKGVIRKPIELTHVGWRIGPALKSARQRFLEYGEEEGRGPGSGRPQMPHQRRAHFKTVWTGKGRKTPKTAFISPYWVHKEMLALGDETLGRTIHPVPAQK